MAKNAFWPGAPIYKPAFTQQQVRSRLASDLGDRFSHWCVLGPDGEVLSEGRVRSTPEAMARHFQELPPCLIAIEFRRLKGYRRIFSRFEKLDCVFLAFLCFALIVEALR
jgi:hypothetical protein